MVAQAWYVKVGITLATMALVGLVFWGLFIISGACPPGCPTRSSSRCTCCLALIEPAGRPLAGRC